MEEKVGEKRKKAPVIINERDRWKTPPSAIALVTLHHQAATQDEKLISGTEG